MLPQALQALTAALKQNTNDLRSRLDWVRLHARNGTEDVVRRWIRRAEIPMDGDAEDLIELAQVLDRFGQRRKALDLGYATLKKNWGASERLHMAFMGLFLISSRSESFLRPIVVAEDSVVILATASGAQRRVRIEKTGSAEQEVLALDHPFAQQLLGKKTKDTVTQEPGIGEGTVWTIQEIKHKYLDLFHTVLEDHPTLFPHTRSFGKYTFDTEAAAESLEPIFEQSRQRARTVDEAIRLYQEHPMPIDGIGKMLGMDGIDASRALRFGADAEFDSCLGLYEERERAIESLLSATRVLVDAITLGIWDEIGLLDDLAAAGIRPNVVQATVDALSIRADEAKGETGRTGGHLGSQDGQIIYTEVSKAERREMARQAAALIDWVRANADILPTDVFQNDLLEQAKDVLSDSTIETINTGIAGGHVILMEDRRARQLAQAGGAEKTAWTQPLLMKLQYEGVISHDRYVALLAKMIVQKLSFVSLGADDLAQAASLGRDSQDFQALCQAMMKPNVDAYSSVQVASDFITSLWQTDRPADLGLAGEILRRTILLRDDFRVFKGVVFQVDRNIRGFGFPFSLWSRLWIAYCENFISGHFIKNQVIALAQRGK